MKVTMIIFVFVRFLMMMTCREFLSLSMMATAEFSEGMLASLSGRV